MAALRTRNNYQVSVFCDFLFCFIVFFQTQTDAEVKKVFKKPTAHPRPALGNIINKVREPQAVEVRSFVKTGFDL